MGTPEGVVELDPSTGEFRIRGLSSSEYVIVARSEGYTPARSAVSKVERGATVKIADLVLARGVALSGRVLDGGTGVPVVGATVAAFNATREPISDTTDGDGAYRIEALSPQETLLLVRHPDYAAEELVVDVGDSETHAPDVLVTGGATLFGAIQDSDGSGIPGVEIEVDGDGRMAPAMRAWSDASGMYRIEHIKEGDTRMKRKSGAEGKGEMEFRHVELALGETRREDFVLGNTLFGEVRLRGAPAPEARVLVEGRGAEFRAAAAVTDRAGAYRISNAPTGDVRVNVEWRGQVVTRRAELPRASVFRLDIDLPGYALSGIVVDRDTGAPIGNARIFVAFQESPEQTEETTDDAVEGFMAMTSIEGESVRALCQSDGTFTVSVPELRTYTLGVDSLDFDYTARLVVANPNEPIRIELFKPARDPAPSPSPDD
jgi:hypothetical protein